MIWLGIAVIVVGLVLCVWVADAGSKRTERIQYTDACDLRGRHRGEKTARQIGGWR